MDHDYQHVEVPALRAEALEAILVEKGLLTPERVDEVIARYNDRIGPLRGAQIVARAWLEPEFKARLLTDANDTSLGFNAATDTYEDLVKAGVIDPTKVVRTALQDAASVAGLLITTEATITEIPDDKPAAPMPDMGGMGGMGGMGF